MKIIGHRGARGLAPENTIISLQKALNHAVEEIEFDVRVTKDLVPVLHHDRLLKIETARLKISKTTYEELVEIKPDLATLDQALARFGDKVHLRIEVKPRQKNQPITAIINRHIKKGLDRSMLSIGSKSQATLRELDNYLPEIHKVVIEPWSGVRATMRARKLRTRHIGMNYRFVWFGFIKAMKRRGYQLDVYTLNRPAKAKKWAKYGLDGVVTDYPDRFKR